MSTIAERFKEIRMNKRWTQVVMSDELAIKRQAIANIEAGKNYPSIETIIKLIEKLNINANWLLTGKGDVYIDTPEELSPEMEKAFEGFLKKKGLI